jgi:CBS domain-containing protein
MPQNIRDVMTSNPCTIDAEKSVAYAAKMMLEEDVGLAPIVEGDRLIGMLTDRDIATRVAAEGRDPDQVKVRDVASKQLITIGPQQDLDEALRKMAKHQVRRLPVVEDGRLVGVVAQADIAREGDDKQTGQLVEEISESGGQMSSYEEVQFPRQVEDEQPQQSLVGQEPQVEEQQEEESISKVQSSSRGRRKRKTAAKKSTGTRKRKTASRKRSTTKRSTTKKRSTAKRKTGARKAAGTRKRKTATRKTAGRKAAATRKRKTATRKTAGRKSAAKRKTGTRKAAGTRRRTTRRKTR